MFENHLGILSKVVNNAPFACGISRQGVYANREDVQDMAFEGTLAKFSRTAGLRCRHLGKESVRSKTNFYAKNIKVS